MWGGEGVGGGGAAGAAAGSRSQSFRAEERHENLLTFSSREKLSMPEACCATCRRPHWERPNQSYLGLVTTSRPVDDPAAAAAWPCAGLGQWLVTFSRWGSEETRYTAPQMCLLTGPACAAAGSSVGATLSPARHQCLPARHVTLKAGAA